MSSRCSHSRGHAGCELMVTLTFNLSKHSQFSLENLVSICTRLKNILVSTSNRYCVHNKAADGRTYDRPNVKSVATAVAASKQSRKRTSGAPVQDF